METVVVALKLDLLVQVQEDGINALHLMPLGHAQQDLELLSTWNQNIQKRKQLYSLTFHIQQG